MYSPEKNNTNFINSLLVYTAAVFFIIQLLHFQLN